ncbi:porin [Burkholderia pseudomallei]|nr:porin [Burkholderia pseudomallei]
MWLSNYVTTPERHYPWSRRRSRHAYYTTGRDHATNAEPKYHQFNLSVEYALSKRTSVYAMGAFQKAAGDAPVAQIAGFNPSGNQKQAVGRAGIRHVF